MQIGQHIAELSCPLQHLLLRLCPLLCQKILQRPALNIIHHDQERFPVFNHIHNAWQMRMTQFFHHLDLFSVRSQIPAALFQNLLDCPLLVDPLVHGKIHDTHTTLTDHIQNLVFSIDHRTDSKHPILPASFFCCRGSRPQKYYPALLCSGF